MLKDFNNINKNLKANYKKYIPFFRKEYEIMILYKLAIRIFMLY
jgi:hypothetical protein